ncbi:hypothetical protein Fmac_006358 [Flemingia macrophylla]|uniref:Uncharacterized protein n=1 Tax=Flemingia macrophylla TaxID=520843 RepID=A0ABD1NAD1_9FABA
MKKKIYSIVEKLETDLISFTCMLHVITRNASNHREKDGASVAGEASSLSTLMPTQKHGDAAAKNVEFGTLLLNQVTALLAKRLAGITSSLLLLLLLILLACVAFLHCHE